MKTYQTEGFFAATPIEALRMVMSLAADDPEIQTTLVDSRAYFNAPIGRKVFVELFPEARRGRDVVGELA